MLWLQTIVVLLLEVADKNALSPGTSDKYEAGTIEPNKTAIMLWHKALG